MVDLFHLISHYNYFNLFNAHLVLLIEQIHMSKEQKQMRAYERSLNPLTIRVVIRIQVLVQVLESNSRRIYDNVTKETRSATKNSHIFTSPESHITTSPWQLSAPTPPLKFVL